MRLPIKSVSSKISSILLVSRSTFLISILLSFLNDSLFISIKFQVSFSILIINVSSSLSIMVTNQMLLVKTLSVFFKPSKKAIIIVKICLFKNLQNGIKNLIEFLEELSWAYKQKHKVDKHNYQEKKRNYISETYQICFPGNLENNVEQ